MVTLIDPLIYFALSHMIDPIAEATGLITGLVILLYFAISLYRFISDSLDDSKGMRK